MDPNNFNPPAQNPLFPSEGKPITPAPNPAADLIRQKISGLYQNEPNAKEELAEAEAVRHRSKHQQFMHELQRSGKSLAEIQTAWHNYYVELPDHEKHEVWQEFYVNHAKVSAVAPASSRPATQPASAHDRIQRAPMSLTPRSDGRSQPDIKQQLLSRIQSRPKVEKGSRLHSLSFGLAMGLIVSSFFLFGFFNERFIAPFITPSKTVSSTPIIIDPTTTPVGSEPKIIIPKINVEVPVVYDEPSIEEADVQRALERGVLHYATTPNPGELGNGVIFGHSSNNIFNKGQYKFAFVMLRHLETGDTFMLQKDGRQYVYRVYEKKIVKPTEVGVLGHAGKPATMTLITCDPPGTSLNRLVIVGEQISPDPAANVASSVQTASASPASLPSDAPTLWSRFTQFFN